MSDFSAIDSNFRVETKIAQADLRFYDPQKEPFQICFAFSVADQQKSSHRDLLSKNLLKMGFKRRVIGHMGLKLGEHLRELSDGSFVTRQQQQIQMGAAWIG